MRNQVRRKEGRGGGKEKNLHIHTAAWAHPPVNGSPPSLSQATDPNPWFFSSTSCLLLSSSYYYFFFLCFLLPLVFPTSPKPTRAHSPPPRPPPPPPPPPPQSSFPFQKRKKCTWQNPIERVKKWKEKNTNYKTKTISQCLNNQQPQQQQQTKKPDRQGPSYFFLQQKVEACKINSGPTNTSLPLFFFLLLLLFLPFFRVAERKHDCELRGLAELFASIAADLCHSSSLTVPRMELYRRNPNLKPLFLCDEFALDDGAGARAPFTTSQLNGFLSIFLCIWRAPYAILRTFGFHPNYYSRALCCFIQPFL